MSDEYIIERPDGLLPYRSQVEEIAAMGKYVMSRGKELGYYMRAYDQYLGEDVLDFQQLYDEFANFKPHAVIHLAGLLGTHELWDTVEAAARTNIIGAYNVAELCMPYNYDAQLVCIEQPHIWYNVYEATKLAARRILTGMHYDQGLKVEFVRAHNAFGPGQAYGEGHPQKIIPTFSVKAWQGEPIPIWGDGSQKVNLVYAGVVADTLLAAARYGGSKPTYTWEAGSQTLWTVTDVAEFVWGHIWEGEDPKIDYLPMRRGEQPELRYPEPDKRYQHTLSIDALRATIDWYKQYQ